MGFKVSVSENGLIVEEKVYALRNVRTHISYSSTRTHVVI